MPTFNFIGGSYQAYSEQADGQRSINLFPENIESGTGKTRTALYGTPGRRFFCELPLGNERGSLAIPFQFPSEDRLFAVGGTGFYEITRDPATDKGIATQKGLVAADDFPAFLDQNGQQIVIASDNRLYVYDLTAGTFSGPILTVNGEILTPSSVVFCDGWFLANTGGQKINFSNLYDGLTWDDLDYFSAESNPDNVVRLLRDHREVWAFGDSSIQVFASTGDTDTPFAAIPGAFIEQGCWAPASPCRLDNSTFWLGGDERGKNIVYRAVGWSATRISSHAIENELRKMSSTILARGWTYTDFGHAFYCLTIPTSDGKTFVYDCATDRWHERGCWNQRTGEWEADHNWDHVWAFGRHIVGDRGGTCCVQTTTSCPTDTGSLLTGSYTLNSRCGPFFSHRLTNNYDGKAWGVFRDPNNNKRLIVQYLNPSSGLWSTQDDNSFTSLTNSIASHDAHQNQYTEPNLLHVLTQESVTGRVAYHQFNTTTNRWALFNSEVSASENVITAGVSCTVRSGGNIVAFYQSAKENVGAADRDRCKVRESSSGGLTWSAAIDIGRTGEAQANQIARAVADDSNRVHCFMNVFPGFFVSATPDFEVRTLRSNNTLSSIVTWAFTGLLGVTPTFYMGNPVVFNQNGTNKLAIPIKRAGSLELDIFDAADTLTSTPLSFNPANAPLVEESALGARYSMISMTAIDGEIQLAFLGLVSPVNGTWATVKTGNYFTLSPSDYDNQVGPRLTPSESGREFGANFFKCHDSMFVATFTKFSGASGGDIMFNLVDMANLPDASTYTLSDWLARFA